MTDLRIALTATTLICALAGNACDRTEEPTQQAPTVTSATPARIPSAPTVNPGWTDAAGPFLLVPASDQEDYAFAILPYVTDSVLASRIRVELDSLLHVPIEFFAPRGKVGEALIEQVQPDENLASCVRWPRAKVPASVPRTWKAGFQKGRVRALPLDSLAGMNPSDSARLASALLRLASSAADGADSSFAGLPFGIVRLYRTTLGRRSIIFGNVVRRINAEANPRAEHTLLIGEGLEDVPGSYRLTFRSRAAGAEDIVLTHEILAAVQVVHTGSVSVVGNFERDEGGRLVLIHRKENGEWKLLWRSAYTGC